MLSLPALFKPRGQLRFIFFQVLFVVLPPVRSGFKNWFDDLRMARCVNPLALKQQLSDS